MNNLTNSYDVRTGPFVLNNFIRIRKNEDSYVATAMPDWSCGEPRDFPEDRCPQKLLGPCL